MNECTLSYIGLTIFLICSDYKSSDPFLFSLSPGLQAQVKQQGELESIHRDLMVGFGSWKFSPVDLENPFPNNEGSVHVWQGDDDKLVPVMLQRYITKKLSWIQYHELPGAGHLFPLAVGMSEAITKALLLGHK
jgi:pimeloyl-ACP methyl ester carboxylesterase